jgi:hypothetical protein
MYYLKQNNTSTSMVNTSQTAKDISMSHEDPDNILGKS